MVMVDAYPTIKDKDGKESIALDDLEELGEFT